MFQKEGVCLSHPTLKNVILNQFNQSLKSCLNFEVLFFTLKSKTKIEEFEIFVIYKTIPWFYIYLQEMHLFKIYDDCIYGVFFLTKILVIKFGPTIVIINIMYIYINILRPQKPLKESILVDISIMKYNFFL